MVLVTVTCCYTHLLVDDPLYTGTSIYTIYIHLQVMSGTVIEDYSSQMQADAEEDE